jgi:hypothetical protein
MKNILLITIIAFLFTRCHSDKNNESLNSSGGIHTVLVEDVLQTNQYTYLHVKEGNNEPWLAVPKMTASAGETYYYKNGLVMNNFESKELNRTFKEILFIDNLSNNSTNIDDKKNQVHSTSQPSDNLQEANDLNRTDPDSQMDRKVVALEVLQTDKYTYIRAKENAKELWIAVSKMNASAGSTYYFKGGLIMKDFASKELKRTFDEILFVDNISSTANEKDSQMKNSSEESEIVSKGSAIDLERKKINMSHGKDDITIAKLMENKNLYSGKKIKVKGQVVKVTMGILNKNWIHLQDGTQYSGKFDLTITTNQEVNVGDNLTAEGTIILNKDFGYGYYYEVIMEDANLLK